MTGRVRAIAYRNTDTTDPAENAAAADVANAAFALLRNAIIMPGPRKRGMNFIVWNDQPGRTVQQIAEVFDQTIAAARQKGDRPVLENASR